MKKTNIVPPEILAKKRALKKIKEAKKRGEAILPAHNFIEEMNKIEKIKQPKKTNKKRKQ